MQALGNLQINYGEHNWGIRDAQIQSNQQLKSLS